MTARYNAVFVGKTGVGKSALINYLYGDKIRETGVGKPITQRGFHCVDFEINGLPVRLFDSWGLEEGREQEWIGLLNKELEKRDTGKHAEQWFHSVFYCIGAGGLKVKDFDTQIIKRFIREKYKVTVILIKADLISEEDEEKLRDTVQNDLGQTVPVIPVCSVEKKLRGGITTEKFGKEDVELQAYNDFCNSIILRLPEHCVKILEQRIDEWYEKQKKYINENTTRWNSNEIQHNVIKESNAFIKKEFEERNTIKQEFQETLKLYKNLVQCLNYPPSDADAIMKLPTEQTEDWEWWESPIVFWDGIICVTPVTGIFGFIIIAIGYLIRAEDNKRALTDGIENAVSSLKQKLPEIEAGIKKMLEKLKEK